MDSALVSHDVVHLLFFLSHFGGISCSVLVMLSSFSIISTSKRESWLLYFNCLPAIVWLLIIVSRLCLAVKWVGQQCVVVVFPVHAPFSMVNVVYSESTCV